MRPFVVGSRAVPCAFLLLLILLTSQFFAQAQKATSPSPPEFIAATGSGATDDSASEGTWRFIVSGDSRNCGDIVMPAIAAHSKQFEPRFYWHLGDLRAIYKVDEDMAAAAKHSGQTLKCEQYQRRAWNDFVENQIAPFGDLPFYLGIGNHEVISPKTEFAFKRQFHDWLDQPALHRQRYRDQEPPEPEPYYHWMEGGVDFIYLDNASGFFSEAQLTWFFKRLSDAKYSSKVKSLVVGMHEALPDSISNDHSMGDPSNDPRGRASGVAVYNALVALRDNKNHPKPVFVLASHSHIFLEDIFNTAPPTQNVPKPLAGWVVGTAGAVRYKRPQGTPPMGDVYGYLVGTVDPSGTVTFKFHEVKDNDVPQWVKDRYPPSFVPWCFQHNSQNVDPKDTDPTCE